MSISHIHFTKRDSRSSAVQSQTNKLTNDIKSFNELLNRNILKENEDVINDETTVSKLQIIKIVNNIQREMESRLIQALSMNSNEDNGLSINRMSNIIPKDSKSSNNCHTTPINHLSNCFTDLDIIIKRAAKTHDVDQALVESVIKVESDYNQNSTSSKGAMGLMQLMPETARDLGVQNAYNPAENVEAGTRYLKKLLNRYHGNIPQALAAYNWGMGNLEKRPDQMPAETKKYIEKVTQHYEKLKV